MENRLFSNARRYFPWDSVLQESLVGSPPHAQAIQIQAERYFSLAAALGNLGGHVALGADNAPKFDASLVIYKRVIYSTMGIS